MASSEMKLRVLCVMRILLEMSDEEHYMTAADIDRELGKYGLSADRRSIYSDLEVLEQFGLDLIRVPGNRGCYVASREFELPELKILTDAVQAARFIPQKKTDELIKKIRGLTSKNLAKTLQRQILLSNPWKGGYETIYYTVDTLHESMNQNCRIRFQYAEWTEKKKLRLRHDGKIYEVSPWGLLWDGEYYYLMGYVPEINGIKHYRVDRIQNLRMLEGAGREGSCIYERYRQGFSSKTFGMYGGDDVTIKMRCANRMAGIIIDRFGSDIMMLPKDGENFVIHVPIAVSPQFFGWAASNGTDIEILEPASIREDYRSFLENILRQYEKD